MWRRTYLLLLVIRVYFAISPSYIHPDEIFQGPEVIAGELFGYQNVRTWEWTVAKPIRSVFPLWPIYGIPMALLKALWSREGDGSVSPTSIYYTLRTVMFVLCFMMETYAIHELIPSPRKRNHAVILVASSYVTWTYQTHTFSNSVETLVVLWCLVLMQRISGGPNLPSSPIEEKTSLGTAVPRRLHIASGLALGFLLVFGVFNRITFPAFLLIPGIQVLPHLLNRPLALIALLVSATLTLFIAIATDTAFYTGPAATSSFRALFNYIHTVPVITPINNILYNTKASNLKAHGLHPYYQHLLINLPQLLGPALLLFIPRYRLDLNRMLYNPRLCAALTGAIILSVIPHQEPRFLLPCIPLLLTCVRLPSSQYWRTRFWIAWGTFNIIMATLMGIYHQGGIVPISLSLPTTITRSLDTTNSPARAVEVIWWKTYPPSLSLMGPAISNPNNKEAIDINVHPLLGAPRNVLFENLLKHQPSCDENIVQKLTNALNPDNRQTLLVAPFSAWRWGEIHESPRGNFSLAKKNRGADDQEDLRMIFLDEHRRHVNLDDMDFGDDGVWGTLERVIGRRGLGVWRVERICKDQEKGWGGYLGGK